MENCMKLAVLREISIATQLGKGYHIAVRRHSEERKKRCHILSTIIDCVKVCDAFELICAGSVDIIAVNVSILLFSILCRTKAYM